MVSRSLRDSMTEAKKEHPSGARQVWEDISSVELEIVNSNAKVNEGFTPQVGLQFERKDTNQRNWFTLYFPQGEEDKDRRSLAQTGRTLSALGCDEVLDAVDQAFPDDLRAQLEGLASAMKGIRFDGKIKKSETNKTKNIEDIADEDREYRNYFDVNSLTEGPYVPKYAVASGFGQAAVEDEPEEEKAVPAAPAAVAAPADEDEPDFKPFGG